MSNGLSQAEIDALLQGGSDTAPASPPAEDPNRMMSPDEIAALLEGGADSTPPPAEDPNRMMSPDEIAALLEGGGDSAPPPPAEDANHMMTPDEIAALLEGGVDIPPELAPEPQPEPSLSAEGADDSSPDLQNVLTDQERDALGEIGNISMGTAATTLFSLLNHRVDITTPYVNITTMGALAKKYPMPFVSVEVQYTAGLEGTNCLFLQEKDVKIITDLMLGGDGSNISDDLNEMHLSCISEVMNQMVGASSTSLAQILKKPIDISPPRAMKINLATTLDYPFTDPKEPVVRTAFNMVVEGLINSEIMQVTPVPFAKEMVVQLMGQMMGTAAPTPPPPEPTPPPAQPFSAPNYTPVHYSEAAFEAAAAPPPPGMPPQQGMAGFQPPMPPPQPEYPQAPPPPQPYPQPYPQQPGPYPPQQPPQPYPQQPGPYPPQPYPPQPYPPYPYPPNYGPPPPSGPQHAPVDIHPAQFGSFGDPSGAGANGENMDMLLDVPLSVSVELGKSRKYIKDILDFNIGTIVVLDKMAGDLVDVMVNGKLIAQGEVVVIDDSYGCRITEIVSPSKRINPLK